MFFFHFLLACRRQVAENRCTVSCLSLSFTFVSFSVFSPDYQLPVPASVHFFTTSNTKTIDSFDAPATVRLGLICLQPPLRISLLPLSLFLNLYTDGFSRYLAGRKDGCVDLFFFPWAVLCMCRRGYLIWEVKVRLMCTARLWRVAQGWSYR